MDIDLFLWLKSMLVLTVSSAVHGYSFCAVCCLFEFLSLASTEENKLTMDHNLSQPYFR